MTLAVLLVARMIWGYWAYKQLDAQVSAIRDLNEPISFDDVVFEAVPDSENAVYWVRQAIERWPKFDGKLPTESQVFWDWERDGKPDPIQDNNQYYLDCEAAIRLLQRAGEVEKVDWNLTIIRPVWGMALPHLVECRMLARQLDDLARRQIELGQYGRCLSIINLLCDLSEIAGDHPVCSLDAIVSTAISAAATERLESLLPHLTASKVDADLRHQLTLLQGRLINEDGIRDCYDQALVAQRWVVYNCVIGLLDDSFDAYDDFLNPYSIDIQLADNPITRLLIRPQIDLALARALSQANNELNRFRTTRSFGSFIDSVDPDEPNIGPCHSNSMNYPVVHHVYMKNDGLVRVFYCNLANLRLANTAIAIKLYEIDYGKRPESLDLLVPVYIASIPTDPFSDDEKAISYVPAGVTPVVDSATNSNHIDQTLLPIKPYALLYSYGSSRMDNNGAIYINENAYLHSGPTDEADRVFLLDSRPIELKSESNSTITPQH